MAYRIVTHNTFIGAMTINFIPVKFKSSKTKLKLTKFYSKIRNKNNLK